MFHNVGVHGRSLFPCCFLEGPNSTNYRTCMANSAENKSFCEVPTYVIQGLTAKVDEICG